MLPKRSRLTKQNIESLKHARRSKSAHFLVIYGPSAENEGLKVAFSASKKVAKGAVVRNTLRRRGYAAIEPLLPRLSPKTLILIVYSTPLLESPLDEMTAELDSVFAKAGLYR